MAHEILNDGDTGLVFRTKLNDNFAELVKLENTKVIVALQTPLAPVTITTTPVTQLFADTVLYAQDMVYTIGTGVYENVFAGLYKFDFFVLANWANGKDLNFSAWVDGIQVGVDVPVTGTGKNLPVTIPYFLELTANQSIEIKLSVNTTTTNVTLVNSSIALSLVILPA